MKSMEYFLIGLCFSISINLMGQNIFIYPEQELNFGEFYLSNNSQGEITIYKTGELTSSGNINLLNSNPHPALFIISTDSIEPIKIEVEAFVQKLYNSDGNEMEITLHSFEPSFYILQEGSPVQIIIGGTLIVNSKTTSSTGNYNGSVSLRVNTFNE